MYVKPIYLLFIYVTKLDGGVWKELCMIAFTRSFIDKYNFNLAYLGMQQIAMLNTSFQNYMMPMNKEIDTVLSKAQET